MSLAHPGWLMLLLIIPFILLGAILAHRGRSKAWQRMVAPRLRKHLVNQTSSTRRWISIVLALLGAALIILVIARPYIGETSTTEQIRTRNILIAIDTSRSMLVKDGSPDRMAAAQAVALELLETFPNDRVGVMAFSGAPVLMAPLTIDHTAVHETISQLNTNVIPTGGSNLNEAVALALDTFKKSGQKGNALIIISDGEDHSEQTEITADTIRTSGTTVCTVSVGSKQGGIIPDYRQPDRKFRDLHGQTVLSQMNPSALDTLARAGNGIYLPASAEASSNVRTALTSLKRHEQAGRKLTIPNEKYQWFLFPAILLLALSLLVRSQLFTHKVVPNTAVTILLILASMSAMTGSLQAAALEQAEHAYQRKDYKDALKLFKQSLHEVDTTDTPAIHFAIGSSAYRLNHWTLATTHFSKSLISENPKLQENSHYNLGKSLFRSGLQIFGSNLANETSFKNIISLLSKQLTGDKQLRSRNYTLSKQSDASDLIDTLDSTLDSTKQPAAPTEEDIKTVTTLWEDSITHYQAALDINPDNQHAANNQKNVQRLLDLLKQSQQSQDQNQDQEDKADKEKEQGHRPETDPNNDPENNEGKRPGDKNKDQGDKNQQVDDPKNNKEDPGDQQSNNNQNQPREDQPQMERKAGESDEAYSARILKENSDAETRPVQRRNIRLRRPAKDW